MGNIINQMFYPNYIEQKNFAEKNNYTFPQVKLNIRDKYSEPVMNGNVSEFARKFKNLLYLVIIDNSDNVVMFKKLNVKTLFEDELTFKNAKLPRCHTYMYVMEPFGSQITKQKFLNYSLVGRPEFKDGTKSLGKIVSVVSNRKKLRTLFNDGKCQIVMVRDKELWVCKPDYCKYEDVEERWTDITKFYFSQDVILDFEP